MLCFPSADRKNASLAEMLASYLCVCLSGQIGAVIVKKTILRSTHFYLKLKCVHFC